MIHELKILPQYFEAVIAGNKTFEIRKNDRDFFVGDYLRLNEFNNGVYTGQDCLVKITYLCPDAPYVPEGYVAMSIALQDIHPHEKAAETNDE